MRLRILFFVLTVLGSRAAVWIYHDLKRALRSDWA
jgi:hypothetical protein